MIKKTIRYMNFAEPPVEVIADFEFHISKAEFAKMELSAEGNSMTEYLKRISKAASGRQIIEVMEQIVEKAYGVRTLANGFDKDPSVLREFKASGAYDALFEELLTSDNAADISAEFVRGLFPADWAEQLPDTAEGVIAEAQKQSIIPAGVRMPADRQFKQEKPVDTAPKVVPFEGDVVNSPHEETVEELRARINRMENPQSGG